MNPSVAIVLWIYAAALVAGGAVGFFKAGSKISLIVSVAAAALVAAVASGHFPILVVQVEAGVLAAYFAYKFSRSRKPMPAIPVIILSLAVLVLTYVLVRA